MAPRPEETAYILKNTSEDQLFRLLRKEGISHIEDLCGKVWTDYNVHDPGITILEQCCYAMTEMAYRSEFDVADILAGESGQIPYHRQGLYPAHEIYPNRALTPGEIENIIYDAVEGVENVWVEPLSGSGIGGLYRIRYRIREGADNPEEILRAVLDVFCQNRSLCEDVHDIQAVENRVFSLHAEVEVAGRVDPALTLARIYSRSADILSPGISYASWDTLVDQETPLEDIFSGPLLGRGFMDGSRRSRPLDFVNISKVSAGILDIEDVLGVKSLLFEDEKTGRKYCDIIPNKDPDTVPWLEIPSRTSRIHLTLYKKRQKLRVEAERMNREYRAIGRGDAKLGLSAQEMARSRKTPGGNFSDLRQYHSIMTQFPNIYGINEFGVPSSYPEKERAKAKQLKAYLLFFEQPMINFMENLARIPDLFSLDPRLDRSTFTALMDDRQAPDIEHLYAGGTASCRRRLEKVSRKYDRFADRRNRALDYLLSLYGEKFSQHALRRFNYYFSQTGLELWLIRTKIRFLKYLPRISGGRAGGFNYLSPSWNTENIDGLKLKVSLLLGFRYHQSRSLTIALTKHGLELIADKDLPGLKQGTVEIQYVEPSDVQGKVDSPFKKVGFRRMRRPLRDRDIRRLFRQIVFLKNNLLNTSFMVNGLDFKNYRVGRFTDRSWQLIFRPYQESRWCYLGSFQDAAGARRAANHLRYFIKTLNIMSEGCHILDHILLRPSEGPRGFDGISPDFFSFRISVVFPSWPARCTDGEFRKLAEETVRINAPAHVAVDIFWLGFQDMLAFEILFHDWLAVKEKHEGPDTDKKALSLIRFLADHRHCKSELNFL